jgi:hypothetical protein
MKMKRPKEKIIGMLGWINSYGRRMATVPTEINAPDTPGQWNGTKESHAN